MGKEAAGWSDLGDARPREAGTRTDRPDGVDRSPFCVREQQSPRAAQLTWHFRLPTRFRRIDTLDQPRLVPDNRDMAFFMPSATAQ